MKARIEIAVLLLVLSLLAGAARAEEPGPDVTLADHPMIGELAPAFDLVGVDGERLSLESLRGRFVVIHFGTSW